MLKKIGKTCGSIIIAFSLSFAFWYFLLTGFPDPCVQGTAASITREEVLDLMNYHGTKVAYVKNGRWVFDRNNETIPLKQKP